MPPATLPMVFATVAASDNTDGTRLNASMVLCSKSTVAGGVGG